jgi:succinate---hydroxymethylglutarate CoA-transferase
MTGLAAAFGLLAGVVSARTTGKGIPVPGSSTPACCPAATPRSAHPSLAPSQLYRTKDGWIFIMCKPEWETDPELATFKARLSNRERITQILDAELMERTTAEWIEHLAGKVPCAPVYDVAQVLQSAFVVEREAVADLRYLDGRSARMIAAPIRVAGVERRTRAAPPMGADTESELRAAGYSPEQIATLRRTGTIA